ncbi:MAG: flagellar hook-associated protein FlgL [Sulfurimicrobium sp.]|jgi:flagellar hook-associated protein 3 FlgL|nr:flagellar hook-associated protein FlgL [Sulfurimicrobium sp.]
MRISTNTIYELGVASMQQQASAMAKAQQQISTGRRILTPEDDPVAAARVLEVSQAKSLNQQYDVNANSATSALGLEEAILGGVTNLLQDVHTTAVTARGPLLDHTSLSGLAAGLRGRYEELLGLANSTDGNGQYMFSGFKGSIQPFSQTSPGDVKYIGDQGQRLIQISPTRQMAVSDSGSDIFMQIKNGNGSFVTAATPGNTGTGLVSAGSALTAYDGNNYQISFTSGTTYDINQVDAGGAIIATPVSGATYTSGSAIAVGGGEFAITGAPAGGDTFTVKPSTNENLFTTLNNLITALEKNPVNKTELQNSLTNALSSLDNGLAQVLTVRVSVGTRMQEVEAVKFTGQDIGLQYDQTLSTLQDLDYTKAITDLTRYQVGLEAAQKSFQKTQGMSLFNYI